MKFGIKYLMALHRMDQETGGEGSAGGGGEGEGGSGEGTAPEQKPTDTKSEEGEGKSKTGPTDEEAKLLKDVMAKKRKLEEAQKSIDELQAKLKSFDGIDPDAVRAVLKEKQEREVAELEKKGDYDRLKKQMVEAHTKEVGSIKELLSAKDAENAALQAQIAELTVGNSFGQSKFLGEEVALPVGKMRALYGAHFEFKDGAVVAYDKPAGKAERTMLVDAKGDPLSFDEAMKKIVDGDPDRDNLLKSKVKPGAGSKTLPGAKAPSSQFERPKGADAISAALAKGIFAKGK